MTRFRSPKRGLGQNFLVDRNVQAKIIDRLAIAPKDLVVEIGPGRGALTHGLLERARELVLIEKDDELAAHWERETAGMDHVRVVHADVLDVPFGDLGAPDRQRVVGNIPYNITAPIIFHVLSRPRPADLVIMVQREVANRILASPGTKEYGALTVGVRAIASAVRLMEVSRGSFHPRPNVDSTVLRIVPESPAPLGVEQEVMLRRLTRAAFGWRRKKLRTVLRDHPELRLGRTAAEAILSGQGIDPDARGETLSPERFVGLAASALALAAADGGIDSAGGETR